MLRLDQIYHLNQEGLNKCHQTIRKMRYRTCRLNPKRPKENIKINENLMMIRVIIINLFKPTLVNIQASLVEMTKIQVIVGTLSNLSSQLRRHREMPPDHKKNRMQNLSSRLKRPRENLKRNHNPMVIITNQFKLTLLNTQLLHQTCLRLIVSPKILKNLYC